MKRYTTIMLFSFIILTTLNAQIKCDFINNASNSSLKVIGADILNWSDYTGYDYTNTAIKVVRLTFHIIQKNDGTNNFINNTISNQFLSVSTMTALNNSMSTNVKMNLGANLAPFQLDTRIRFELANIYYWNDDYDNVYRDNNGYNMITKYVVNKPNVMFKDNSVHIFFCMDGGACGYAGYGGQYVILSDMSISPASSTYLSIKHELGHCMGLQHSWIADDECDDTPPNPNCWDENQCQGIPSNNMMDYNNSESALTQCQINKMHNTLLRGGSVPVSKCVANILSFDSPYLQSNSEFLCLGNSPNTSKVVKLPFGVTVDWIPPSITDYYISIIAT